MKSLRALGTVARVKGLGLAVALRLPQCFLSEDGTALGATSETIQLNFVHCAISAFGVLRNSRCSSLELFDLLNGQV